MRSGSVAYWGFVASIALSACDNVKMYTPNIGNPFATQLGVTYEPQSAVSPGPALTGDAIRVYPADVPALRASGGVMIGTLEIDVQRLVPINGQPTTETLAQRARSEAAKHGGTHVVMTSAGADVHEQVVQPETVTAQSESVTDRNGHVHTRTVETKAPEQTSRWETPRARFAVYRVAPEQWAALPDSLRPTRIADAQQPASAPAPAASSVALTSAPVAALNNEDRAKLTRALTQGDMYADMANEGVKKRDCAMAKRGIEKMNELLEGSRDLVANEADRAQWTALAARRNECEKDAAAVCQPKRR